MITTKNQPRIVNVKTGEAISLGKNKGMFKLDVWLWIPTGQAEREECSDFAADVSCSGDVFVSLRLEVGKRTEQEKMINDKSDIIVCNGDQKMRGEEMECDDEEQAPQESENAKTSSDPGQPSKREREEHVATHVQYGSWCVAYVRGGGVAMKHFRSASAHDERMHTLVVDYCFPSEGGQQGITVLVVKEMKTNAVGAFMVSSKEVSEHLVETVVDFMSGCECGQAILKGDDELATVPLQEAVKNAWRSDTVLENSLNGDGQWNGAAELAVWGTIRTDTNVESVRAHQNER